MFDLGGKQDCCIKSSYVPNIDEQLKLLCEFEPGAACSWRFIGSYKWGYR